MRGLLVAQILVLASGCEETPAFPDGSSGPPPCDQFVEVDGGAPLGAAAVDHVVAAADLRVRADGTYAAAVELWDGASWRVGAAFTDATPPLLLDLGAPPAGLSPPLAQPRLALSAAGEPAVAFLAPSAGGGW